MATTIEGPLAITNLPGGISTDFEYGPMGQFGMPDPTQWHVLFNDFNSYIASEWTVTETQAGATQAVVTGDGGLLALVNSAADDDINAILGLTSFTIEAGKKTFFAVRLKVDDATQSEVLCGLTTTPTAFNPTAGIYFYKTDGTTQIRGTIENGSGQTNFWPDVNMADDTFITLAWYYDGIGTITGYADGVNGGSTSTLTFLPTATDLGVLLGVRNGEAVAKTLTVDYAFAAKQR